MSKLTAADIFPNQNKCITEGYERDAVCIVAPLGLGKTLIGNRIATERIADGINKRCLVIAPKKLMHQWTEEPRKWDCLTPVVEAVGSSAQRKAIIDDPANTIVCLGIDLLKWFKDTYKTVPFDLLIIDELSKFSAAGAVSVKAMRHLRKQFTGVIALTGNPVMESPMSLYAQCLVLDGGETLGRNLEAFKREYFYALDFMGYNWALQPNADARLMKKVKPLFYQAEATDYTDSLPPLYDRVIEVELPSEAKALYAKLANEMLLEMASGAEVEASNSAVLSSKFEQIAQGALYDTESDYHAVHSAKMDKLKALIAKGDARQVVVYYFKYELEWLKLAYPDAIVLNEDKAALQKFEANPKALLLIHPKSASHGLNLQSASRMICTKPIWSADQWSQIVARIHRRGQQAEFCERLTLVASGTVDEVILARVEGKQQSGSALLDHLKNV